MTTNDAYLLGWVYGTLTASIRKEGEDEPLDGDWGARPFSCLAKITSQARRMRLLNGSNELDKKIAEALAGVKITSPEMDGCEELVQPLPIQGSWQLGYYAGLGGVRIPSEPYDLLSRRKAKGMTQTELADAIGVTQSKISAWEQNPDSIPKKHMEKLEEALG